MAGENGEGPPPIGDELRARHMFDKRPGGRTEGGGEKEQKDPYEDLRSGFSFNEEKPKETGEGSSEQSQEPSEQASGKGAKDFLKGAVVGGVVGAVADEVVDEGAKFIRRKLYGGSGERKKIGDFIRERQGRKGGLGRNSGSVGAPPSGSPPGEPPGDSPPGPEIPPQGEKPSHRSFNEIQAELIQLIDHPDDAKETELKMERARLLREAKEIGLFDPTKKFFNDVQLANDFLEAEKIIKRINVVNLENEARGISGWSNDFEGMLGEYKEVASKNMRLALARAQGDENSAVAKRLEREIEIRGWGTLPPNLDRLARGFVDAHIQEQTQPAGVPDATNDRLVQIAERQLTIDEAQLELMRKGLRGLIQGVAVRAHVNPEQYDQNLPPWFEELPEKDRRIFRNLLHVNYLAAVKRDTGMISLDEWSKITQLRFEREAFADMMAELPGFREAMATMVHDIFEHNPDTNHLIISGKPGYTLEDTHKNPYTVEPTEGYAIVGSAERLNLYKGKLIDKIRRYLDATGNATHIRYRVSNRDLAELAVASVDNILFAFGAYDSGDELRAIQPGDSNVYSETIRALYMPGLRGWAKWKVLDDVRINGRPSKNERMLQEKATWPADVQRQWDKKHGFRAQVEKKVKEIVKGKETKIEAFGGPIGAWIRDNILANRGTIRKDIVNQKLKLIPPRFYYSLLDTQNFADNAPRPYTEQPLSQVLIHTRRTEVLPRTGPEDVTLYDYVAGPASIPINQLGSDELIGNYADVRSSVIGLYNHVTGNNPREDRLDIDRTINALIKMRKEKILNEYATNEDFVLSCVIMLASPEKGLTKGTDQMLLDGVDEDLYDAVVSTAVSDPRLFEGLKRGARERIIRRLHALDMRSVVGVLAGAFPGVADAVAGFIKNSRKNIRRGLKV